MNKDQAGEIDQLMKRYAGKGEQQRRVLDEHKRAEDEFYVAFRKLCAEVIKPTMEKVAKQLNSGGHTTGIKEADSTTTRTMTERPGPIRFELLLAGIPRERYGADEVPGVTFSPESSARIGVYSGSGGPQEQREAGPHHFFRIDEITPQVVTAQILEVLRKTVGPA